MKLSDHLHENLKEDFSNSNIKLGSVIRMFVYDTTPPKTKLFIIVGIEPENISLATVYINTYQNEYVKRNPKIKRQHILIKKSEQHNFLKYDSYVNCAQIKIKNFEELKEKTRSDPSIIKGTVSDEVLELITRKLSVAEDIRTKHKKRFNLNRFSDFD